MEKKVRKLIDFLVTLVLSVSIIFFAIRLAPGDPIERLLGPQAKMEEVIKYKEQIGFDKSLITQYKDFIFGVVKLDLGKSLFKKQDVLELIKTHFGPSFTLAFWAIFISFFWGTLWGVITARFKGKSLDVFVPVFSLFGLSFPIFALAPLLVLVFAIYFQWFPVSEWGELKHTFLPVLTLVIPLSTILLRVTRNRFLEDLHEPWVQVLEAKGLSRGQILARVFKVTLPSVLNVVAIQLSVVLAGTIITETIYDIPGMGLLLFDAIQNRDYPLVQGVVAFITIIYMLVYFLVEWLNQYIDPRIAE